MKRYQILGIAALLVLAFVTAIDPSFSALLHGHAGHVGQLGAVTGFAMLGNLSPSSARVIDPVLTNVAQGYRNAEFVGSSLFPRVPVAVSGGQIIEFGKEGFKAINMRRAPGAGTRRLEFGYQGKPFALVEDALEGKLPREFLRDAQRAPGIDLAKTSINTTMRVITLGLEIDQAAIARNAANYDANHKIDITATPWTDNANDPSVTIKNGREAIRTSVGIYPNKVILSAKAFTAAINNTNITGRFKYTSAQAITEDMLARLWNVDKVEVGGAITMDDAGNVTDIWGPDVVMAYVPLVPSTIQEPSYGYTYTMENNPIVEPTYYDKREKSWIYPITYERAPVLSGMAAGYLIQNAG